MEVDNLMKPAPNRERCLLCRYSCTNQFNELVCIFLVEMYITHRIIPHVDCPLAKE